MLYNLSEVYKDLGELYASAESQGELDAIYAQMELLEAPIDQQLEDLCKIERDSEREFKKIEAELSYLKMNAELAKYRQQQIKQKVKAILENIGEKKKEVGIFKIAIQKNGGNPAVEIEPTILNDNGWLKEPSLFPDAVKKFIPAVAAHYEPDIAGVVKEYNEGNALPEGFKAFRGSHIRIK